MQSRHKSKSYLASRSSITALLYSPLRAGLGLSKQDILFECYISSRSPCASHCHVCTSFDLQLLSHHAGEWREGGGVIAKRDRDQAMGGVDEGGRVLQHTQC